MITATLKEFADLLGVKPSYVTKLKQHDRLVITHDGLVDVEASRQRIEATKDPNRDDVRARHAAAREQNGGVSTPPAPESPAPPADPARGAEAISASFQKSRALGEHFAAKTRALEFLKEVGEVVELAVVRDEVENILAITRAAFDNLPSQLAPQLATMTDETAIDRAIQDQLETILGELAQRLRAMTQTNYKRRY
jgi:hypothetical protein